MSFKMVTEKINDVENIFKYIAKKDNISYEKGICKSPIKYNSDVGYMQITNHGKTASLDLIVQDEQMDLLDIVNGLEMFEKKKVLDELINQDEKFYEGMIEIVGEFIKTCSMIG